MMLNRGARLVQVLRQPSRRLFKSRAEHTQWVKNVVASRILRPANLSLTDASQAPIYADVEPLVRHHIRLYAVPRGLQAAGSPEASFIQATYPLSCVFLKYSWAVACSFHNVRSRFAFTDLLCSHLRRCLAAFTISQFYALRVRLHNRDNESSGVLLFASSGPIRQFPG